MFFITKLLFVIMITLHKTKIVSFYYLMSINEFESDIDI